MRCYLLYIGVHKARVGPLRAKECTFVKFAFFTLGCKVNLFETQALSQLAQARGHEIVDKDADAVIVNTCTVTSVSDHKNIRAFHKLRRDNPNAVIAACGCFAQTDPERVRATGEIDLICGTRDRAQVIDLCEQAVSGQAVQVHESEDSGFETLPAGIPHGRTRALLKIEDGCNNFCTYCIIPYARGRVRSLPVEQALEQTARLADAGVHEIVLTGIEIASYGRDLPGTLTLADAVETVAAAAPQMRLRLGSIEPTVITEDFCRRAAATGQVCRHFHLSLQSGCDRTLARMNRKYTTAEFLACVERLRRYFPGCALTADMITGFPGETEDDQAQAVAFLERVGFAAVHVFPYSRRPGTKADAMPEQLSHAVKSARAHAAQRVADDCKQRYLAQQIGQVLPVLFETEQDGRWVGHSDNYCLVSVAGDNLRGVVKNVKISAISGQMLVGDLV